MAPSRRTKRKPSTPEAEGLNPTSLTTPPSLAPAAHITPARPKSPLRRVIGGGITKAQKESMMENLRVELDERKRKLRAQYVAQAKALRQKIEMRIHRIPRKYWDMKMGDLLASVDGGKGWVKEVKRLSSGPLSKPLDEKAVRQLESSKPVQVAKKRSAEKATVVAVNSMAPPPRPVSPLKRPVSPLKRPASPQKSDPPVPPPARSNPRTVRKAPSRSNLKSTATDSEAEKAPPPAKRSTAKSTATAKTAKATAAKTSTSSSSSSSRTVKGLNSSGSLKENKVKGVKEEEERPATSASNGRRVLRARK